MILGEKIRELREAKGWSQTELAKKVSVTQSVIHDIEAGKFRSSRALPQLAAVFEAEVWEQDPGFPVGLPGRVMEIEAAAAAFEAILERLRTDYGRLDLQALSRVFLDLALEPLPENTDMAAIDIMRERIKIAIRPYLRDRR